ncbi:phage antirepressor KilAC domain-containing protein [Candidatus Galacturonibacter soehngenii]|uniref:Oxidoreductase n=1 Tax=Candidatus Galacturonatibacter soehngenii TaxID=2307010 RepID=A0A7V7UBH1_9FIRM|nr:phage antirepressor KilAC domain-containing protein [Candidatus Galacturonibacter soehngenii]KAB1437584.1 oxidoreductase [Candidatus Galacturonibacter soehngenii]
MNELTINYETNIPTVSARDLYDSVSGEDGISGTERFSKWFERYAGYGFEEGKDFSTPYKKVRVQLEGTRYVSREVEDYDLSVDMAKQICMLQRTEHGKKVRQHLIEVENAWNSPEQLWARAIKIADKKIEELKSNNNQLLLEAKQNEPKIRFVDAVTGSRTSILIGDLAKILKQNGIDIGQNRLFDWMYKNDYLIYGGSRHRMPTQRAMNMGLFEIREGLRPDGEPTRTTLVTGKGQQYFINKFLKDKKSA